MFIFDVKTLIFCVHVGETTTEEAVEEDMVAMKTDETVALAAVEERGRIVEGLGKSSENLLQVHNFYLETFAHIHVVIIVAKLRIVSYGAIIDDIEGERVLF